MKLDARRLLTYLAWGTFAGLILYFGWFLARDDGPSLSSLASMTHLKIDESASVVRFERPSDGKDPEFVMLLSVDGTGGKFCTDNKAYVVAPSGHPGIFMKKGYTDMLPTGILCELTRHDARSTTTVVAGKNHILIHYYAFY